MTIRDVAVQAVATVSEVINDRYGVSSAASSRVQHVIDDESSISGPAACAAPSWARREVRCSPTC